MANVASVTSRDDCDEIYKIHVYKETKMAVAPKTAEKGKAAQARKPESKEIVTGTDADALRKRARAASQLAAGNTGSMASLNYLSLCQSNTKAKKKAFPDTYIKELSDGQFFIQSKKLVLGEEVRFVPLAFFQIYQEYQTDPQVTKDAKMVGVWLPEDAEKLEPQYGKQWNRETEDGHVLCPAWWIFGYLPDFPDEDRVVLTYKSTGNKTARKWFKDASQRAPDAPFSLIYKLVAEEEVSGSNSWLKVTPVFDSCVYTLDKDGDLDKINEDFVESVIDRAGALNKAFAEGRLVAHHAVNSARAARDVSETDDDADDEGETPDF